MAADRKLGIIELLTRVGEPNIKLQNIGNDLKDIALTKGRRETKVTFYTDPELINPGDVVAGRLRHVGLVLWLPKELVEKAKADHANEPRIPAYDKGWPNAIPEERAKEALPDATPEEAYRQGAWAFGFAYAFSANPYPSDSEQHDQWAEGWDDGNKNHEG